MISRNEDFVVNSAPMPRDLAEAACDNGHNAAGHLAYWREQLAGATPLDLPSDHPRPSTWTGHGAGHTVVVDAALATSVRALARSSGTVPIMAMLATWTALLGRLCDTTDVVVGASTDDRGRPMLVIRTDLARPRSFAELLAALRGTYLDALAHQSVPFDRLVAELAPERRVARTPLFNVNFVYRSAPVSGPAADEGWADLEVSRLTPTRKPAFDLILAVQDRPDGTMLCSLQYSTELFERETVERIGRCYVRLLAEFTADPDAPLGSVGLLSEAEWHEIVVDLNATVEAMPDGCLHTIIERQARRTPDAVAVACGGRLLSYAELDAHANRLAHYLRGQGVGPEAAVAIWLPRSADQIVAMLAVWKAGGYCVPMDDEHPADRVATMLADAAPVALITLGVERLRAGEYAGVVKAVCLHRDAVDIDGLPTEPPDDVDVSVDELAAAIYTSGSTGTPKAVALTHRNVVSAQVGRRAYQEPPRSMLLPVSFAFDVFLHFAAWALSVGGRVVVPVHSRGADLDELASLLRTQRVTHLVGSPDLQRALLARDDVRSANHLVLGIVGGQSCPQALAEDYARHTAGARLVNEYGLTETSFGTCFITDGTEAGLAGGQLPIGRPVANYRVYLLDANLQPVPVGVPAELYIGGPGVARGYLGRPELTAQRFIPDPFGEPGQRLCRTGDLARFRPDRQIEFLGRRDRQIKIRGFRIELAEIEAALVRHEAVTTVAVVHLPDRQELVGYVVGGDAGPPSAAELRAHLGKALPEPMVPAAFVVLDAMPLTPHGKIDRMALAELRPDDQPAQVQTAPRTPVEKAVAAVWAEVLKVSDGTAIDVHADFFEVGGHSLLATTVVSRLRARFPVPLDLRDLFVSPTVAGLAELIGARLLEPRPGQSQADTAPPTQAAQASAARDSLRTLVRFGHAGVDAPPWFCVHPGNGSAHWYAELQRAFGAGQPVAAFEWPGLCGPTAPAEYLGSAPLTARRYLSELRDAQPSGPYRLFGWCGGAAITWDMARQLSDRGEQVELVLLDPIVDVADWPTYRDQLVEYRHCEALFDALMTAPNEAAARWLSEAVVTILRKAIEDPDMSVTGDELNVDWRNRLRGWRQLMEVNISYAFQPYRGRLHLLTSDELRGPDYLTRHGVGYQQFLDRWRELAAGGLSVHELPGDHIDALRRPRVTELASLLSAVTLSAVTLSAVTGKERT
jgi:amino acid adenylation domain-containing protein